MSQNVSLTTDTKSIGLELAQAGFETAEIDQAMNWLQGFSSYPGSESQTFTGLHNELSTRVFSLDECEHITVEAQGLLIYLQEVGILNATTREIVIDRLMALGFQRIDIMDIKWVVLMVLFHQKDNKAALALMQDLVMHGDITH